MHTPKLEHLLTLGERLYDESLRPDSIAWSADSTRLLVSGRSVDVDNSVMLTDDAPWALMLRVADQSWKGVRTEDMGPAMWQPGSEHYLTAPSLQLRSLDGTVIRQLDGPGGTAPLAWSPDGRRVASGGVEPTGVWRVEDGVLECRLGPPMVHSLAWISHDQLAIGCASGLEIRRLDDTLLLQEPGDVRAVALRPSGTHLAIGGDGLRLVHAGSGDPLWRHTTDALVRGLAWSPDGDVLAISDDEGTTLVAAADGSEQARLDLPGSRGHRLPAWSPDGRWLAVVLKRGVKYLDLGLWRF